MAAVADVRQGQTDIPCKGEFQTLTGQSMRYQVCPGETSHTTISEYNIILAIL